MSTARRFRRSGVGSAVIRRLLAEAQRRGMRRVVLGTEAWWDDAVAFYLAQGFRKTRRSGTAQWFAIDLPT
jgi:ribosomal protein S18 acetylase RimI-like enzyme